jgi:Contractile injection system tube protein
MLATRFFMTTFPGSPRLLKGAIVSLNPTTKRPNSLITFQYNPETLTRTLQVQQAGQQGSPTEALRLKGAPTESIKLDIHLDATDQLEKVEPTAVTLGVYPQLSALELLIYPKSRKVAFNMAKAAMGSKEVAPLEAPITLLVWGVQRVLPVRITGFSVAEEAYDVALNPIRVKVSLEFRVLSYDDLPWNSLGSRLFFAHQVKKEQLGRKVGTAVSGINVFI